jgi:hypothetical protein
MIKSKGKQVLIILGIFILSLAVWSLVIEPAQLKTKEITIELPRWHPAHEGLKIAILTDLHVGAPHMNIEKLRLLVTQTNQQQPDLVVILGDLVIQGVLGGKFVVPELIAAELKNLQATKGVVAVLGNHDWWYDGVRVTNALQQVGVQVLENEAISLEKDGHSFWLAGLADIWTRKVDLVATLKLIKDDNPIILLTHNPDIFPAVPGRVSLTLAGHTHGGQVALPFIGRPIVPSKYGQRYAVGHIVEQSRHLFVSTGVGTSILPMRFCVPPEIVIMKIKTRI